MPDDENMMRSAQDPARPATPSDEETRSQAEWLRVTLSSITDAVISIDADARVRFMNATAESFTGWSASEARGKALSDIYHLLDENTRRPRESASIRVLREGCTVRSPPHAVLVAEDGTERFIEGSAAPVLADGVVTGCVLIFRDITDRYNAEQLSRRRDRDMADFFENANVGLHWVAPDGVILRVNQAELDLLGYTEQELVGRHIAEFHADPAVADDMTHRLSRGESLQGYPARLRHKDGSTREVLINSSALFDNDRLIHNRCFTLDVTARRLALDTQLRLAAIVETSDDAIVSKNLDGVINSWNPGAERLFGYTAAEAIGRHIDLIIPPELRDEERTILRRLRSGERIHHYETVRCSKDGRRINISLSISPLKDSSGTIIGASKVARDITERKRSEAERERLLASEQSARTEAERANRLKDEFLATLSHELRTPLHAILGWVHILQKQKPTPEVLEQGLNVIERNSRMQSQLVSDLLDMSRIISGKMRLDVQRVELPIVIEAAIDSIRPAAEAKGIRLQSVLEPITDPVHGDPARLQQIVWNILSNAVKFTPKGGRVQVVLTRVNSHIEISVSDTGKGIKPEFLPYIFSRFRQADSSAARQHGGLGIGLSIVKQLAELHGGSIQVSSDGEGQGATFTLMLPLAVVHRDPVQTLRVHPRSSGSDWGQAGPVDITGVRVLVIDDERDARDLIGRVLEESGACVLLAASATEALELLKQERPDVILSDIGMPGQDGYALMQTIRRSGLRAPAAALTAFARSEDRTRALQAGYQTHLAKPIEPVELLAAVAALSHTSPLSDRESDPA